MPLRLRVCGRRAAAGSGGGEGDGDVTVAGDAGITSGELGTDDSGLHGEDWPDDRGSEAMGEPRVGEASSGDTGPDGLGEARAGKAGPGEKGPDTLGEAGAGEARPGDDCPTPWARREPRRPAQSAGLQGATMAKAAQKPEATGPGRRSAVHEHGNRGHAGAPCAPHAQQKVPRMKAMATKRKMALPESPNEPHDQCLHHG